MDSNSNCLTFEFCNIVFLDSALRIEYAVQNTFSRDILVFDVIKRIDRGRIVPDPDAAYVLDDASDSVHVTCSAIEIPYGLKTEPRTPFARRIVPTGLHKRLFTIPLPLTARHPYPFDSDQRIVKASKLRFSVSYLADLYSARAVITNEGELYSVGYASAMSSQVFISSQEKVIDIIACVQ